MCRQVSYSPGYLLPIAVCAALGVGLNACAPPRTAAATQPSPAAFDPAMSDEQALTAVDAMIQAIGGNPAWAQVKQLRWEVKYHQDGTLQNWVKHAWDLWNGRHRFEQPNMQSYTEAQTSGRDDEVLWYLAMYDLFDRKGRAYASFAGRAVTKDDRDTLVDSAYKQWQQDSYQLTLIHKLRDPGVKLNYVGESKDVQGRCQSGCIVVSVTYAPEVGSDSYRVHINKDTNMPEIYEKRITGGQGLIGFGFEDWTEVNGLKFPQKFQNLGFDGIYVQILNIEIGEPDDSLYIPPAR